MRAFANTELAVTEYSDDKPDTEPKNKLISNSN